MESKNLQKGCGQDQLVLLFAGQDEGAGKKSSGFLPVASSWRGRECLMEWEPKQTIPSVSATTLQGPDLLLTREMEEMWEARHETGKALLGIVTITSELPHFLQHLSSLDQRAKLRLAKPQCPLQSHPSFVQ